MLKKIISVRNVGRFVSSAHPGVPACAKFTLVLGANGYGKTTLCAILRSLSANEPALITGRHRIGSSNAPQVEILLDTGSARFENAAWSLNAPEIIAFDGAFIAENVYSGDAVDLDQKRNLYRVIVGREGVGLALEEERLASDSRTKASEIRAAEKAIQSHVPSGMKLDDFHKLAPDDDIQTKITAQASAVAAAREASTVKARAAMAEVRMPALPPHFDALLAKTLDDIADDAQRCITNHITHLGMGSGAEAWIAEGVEHLDDDVCPYCGQEVMGLPLIEAYRRVFGEAYGALKGAIMDMRAATERDLGDRVVATLEATFQANSSAAEFWSKYCKLPEAPPPIEAVSAISLLKEAALALLGRKSAAPQEAVAKNAEFAQAAARYEAARVVLDAYNSRIRECNALIVAKKSAVAASDPKREDATLALLEARKKRHAPAVATLCAEYQTLLEAKRVLDASKSAVREKLEDHAKKVVQPYEARINELLDNFNAGFRIAQTRPAYAGGVASSTYQIVINHTGIEVGDGSTPLDRPSFKNTLSAGDRSTLALAFFITHLERDPDRANRIVIFDDPFTSQDSFRRRQTVHEIRKAGAICQQAIILSHDATFLRQIWEKCGTGECTTLLLADHRGLGVKIIACDLDEACRGRAASEIDDLQSYMATGAGKDRDIIKKMRIVLETHCRSTYAGSFAPDDRLGSMVEKIKKAGDQHPAWAIVDELEQINDYSRDHHHGEDPQDGSSDLIDTQELTGFVKRTLRIVNNLQA
jgi:wobble nucleotide-excising tRNase